MNLNDLNNIDIKELLNVFNTSFENYFVPIKLSEKQLLDKIRIESIDLSLSAGAFKDGRLVGFILHAAGNIEQPKTFYNAGTGVIPSERGQKIVQKLYDYIIPILKAKKFEQGTLEVINENAPAIHAYRKVGFNTIRELPCRKGNLQQFDNKHDVLKSQNKNWELFRTLWDWQPTWQNSPATIDLQNELLTAIVQENNQTIAYAIFNPDTSRVHQFAVHPEHRRKYIGTALFQHIASKTNKNISTVNTDQNDKGTQSFLEKIGLHTFITQQEMALKI